LPDLRRTLRLIGPLADDGLLQLRARWRQQALTLLGIVWGSSAVILLLSIGAGFYGFIDLGFKKTGDRHLIAHGQFTSTEMGGTRPGRKIALEREDLERLRASAPSAALVGAQFQRGSISARTAQYTRTTVVAAVTPEIQRIKVHTIERGRYVDEDDDRSGRRVAVLGANLVPIFYGAEDPLGQTIHVHGRPFLVVGTLRQKGAQLVTNRGLHDDMIFIPMRAGQRLFGMGDEVGSILAEPYRVDETGLMQAEFRELVGARHHLDPDDEQAVDFFAMRDAMRPMLTLGIGLEVLLGAVGTVILFMAGAGLANLMVATVNQRRIEFAVRRACGARRSDLVLQLLVETLVVVLTGGVLGAAIAWALLAILNSLSLPPMIPVPRIATSVVVTTVLVLMGVGVVSGIAPARAASRVDPATALRAL
jgi:putative ABC transport system permease protein